jgi:antitoxin component YwqK of YwqJK toxin-antitoxin module
MKKHIYTLTGETSEYLSSIEYWDEHGNCTGIELYSEDGTLRSRETMEYGPDNSLAKHIIFDDAGEPTQTITWEHRGEGDTVIDREITTYLDGSTDETETHKRGNDILRIEHLQAGVSTGSSVNEYADGKLIRSRELDAEGGEISRIEYAYEENRRIIREIEPGEPEILITEDYDTTGRLIRETRNNGHYSVTEQRTYDDAGNIILKETFDGTVLVESRRAEYDRDGRVTAEEVMMNHPHQQGRMARRYEYDIEGRVTAIYGTHGAQRMEYHGY